MLVHSPHLVLNDLDIRKSLHRQIVQLYNKSIGYKRLDIVKIAFFEFVAQQIPKLRSYRLQLFLEIRRVNGKKSPVIFQDMNLLRL